MREQLLETIEAAEALDAPAEPLAGLVRRVAGQGAVKDVLSGTWLGHPLHPLLTDLPVGAWTAAALLDLAGRDSADALIGIGLAAVPATAVSGLSDWSDLLGRTRRVGMVHAAANTTASVLYLLSLRARRRGRRGRGRVLGFLGLGAVAAGGFLGGHLSYRLGVGVDHTMTDEPPDGWTDVAASSDVVAGTPSVARAGDVPVLLVRTGRGVHAVADRCSHLAGPLHDGELQGDCIVCPWHQSVFRVDDGSVVHGPATAPQPRFEVEERDGRIRVRACR